MNTLEAIIQLNETIIFNDENKYILQKSLAVINDYILSKVDSSEEQITLLNTYTSAYKSNVSVIDRRIVLQEEIDVLQRELRNTYPVL